MVQSMTASQPCDTCLQLKADASTRLSQKQSENRTAVTAATKNEEVKVCVLSSNHMHMWPAQLPCGYASHNRQTSIATQISFMSCALALQAFNHDLNMKKGVLRQENEELEERIAVATKDRNRQRVSMVSQNLCLS